jgi:subtilisin family serine protease
VEAPWAWAQGYTGEGVVVAGQDTGYAWEHEARKTAYRGYDATPHSADHDFNWHDAIHEDVGPPGANDCGFDSPVPCDDHGHGTHTMGTMVGNNLDPADPAWPAGAAEAIGVAPGADWIACRNMENGYGKPSTYIECYEWFVAPYPLGGDPLTDGDPAKAPDVINNSWSCIASEGCTPDKLDVIEPAVAAADAAGIVVVTAAGNEGSACGTISFPSAIYPRAFSVGATNSVDALAPFSSRGPVVYQGKTMVKPDVAAPGVSVRSSFPPNHYGNLQGTSMASPHAAAVIALLLDAAPGLRGDTDLIKAIVRRTSDAVVDLGCGGEADGVPNNRFGWGVVDARRAIESLSQQATLAGRVTDSRGQPLEGAVVTVYDGLTDVGSATTDSAGEYELSLEWGSYRVSGVKAGYHKLEKVGKIYLVGGETTIQDLSLDSELCFVPMILH